MIVDLSDSEPHGPAPDGNRFILCAASSRVRRRLDSPLRDDHRIAATNERRTETNDRSFLL